MANFEKTYRAYAQQIRRIAANQRVPGLDPDDIASEMTVTLWKATATYTPSRGKFGPYWWSLWLNRRSDLTKAFCAAKRPRTIVVPNLPEQPHYDVLFPMPPTTDALGQAVWGALAQGDTPTEVREDHEISKRRYYAIIQRWRTEEVRDQLRD